MQNLLDMKFIKDKYWCLQSSKYMLQDVLPKRNLEIIFDNHLKLICLYPQQYSI